MSPDSFGAFNLGSTLHAPRPRDHTRAGICSRGKMAYEIGRWRPIAPEDERADNQAA